MACLVASEQEAKIQEEKLEKWMAFVPSYDSYWAFSQEKKGYSGKWEICVSFSSMLKKVLVFSNGFCEKCNISCVIAFSVMVAYVKRQVVDSRLVSYMS